MSRLELFLGDGMDNAVGVNKGADVPNAFCARVSGLADAWAHEYLEYFSCDLANLAYTQSDKAGAAVFVAIARWSIS